MKLNWFKISYGFLILLMGLLLVQYSAQVSAGGHSWKTGDWLINYSDGLIRRGLSGSLFLWVAQAFSINVKWVAFTVQTVIFVAFVYFTLAEFYQFKKHPKSVLLLLSPAFAFMFWVNDPAVAFRKEICIYLALIFALKAFHQSEVKSSWYWSSLALFVFAGLSHEITVFFLPFFFFAIFNRYDLTQTDVKSLVKYSLPFMILGMVILFGSFVYKGSQQSMDAICASLQPYDLKDDICDGAIGWLQYDAKFGFDQVLKLGPVVWLNYLLLAILSMLPLLFLRGDKYFWLLAVAGSLCMLPLFLVAVDYGRFISMVYTSVVLTCIWMRPQLIKNTWSIHGAIGFLYSFFWALPNCCKNAPGKGILGDALASVAGF